MMLELPITEEELILPLKLITGVFRGSCSVFRGLVSILYSLGMFSPTTELLRLGSVSVGVLSPITRIT